MDKALLPLLETVLGLEDAYKLLEVAVVDAHNQRIVNKRSDP